MALELEYRNTFIDVKEESQDELPASRNRAHSSPPGRVRRSSFAREINDDEAAMRSYLGGLVQTAMQISQISNTVAEDPPLRLATDFTPVEREQVFVLSEGSWGHPDVCRRPCIHFISGNCENGKDCAYCHLPHMEKMAKLDKRQRAMVQQLTHPELVSMVLPFCSRKAEEGGYADKAEEILGLLEMRLDHATSSSESPLADRELRNLRKTLARMSFSSLIGLISRTSHDEDEDSCGCDSIRGRSRLFGFSREGRGRHHPHRPAALEVCVLSIARLLGGRPLCLRAHEQAEPRLLSQLRLPLARPASWRSRRGSYERAGRAGHEAVALRSTPRTLQVGTSRCRSEIPRSDAVAFARASSSNVDVIFANPATSRPRATASSASAPFASASRHHCPLRTFAAAHGIFLVPALIRKYVTPRPSVVCKTISRTLATAFGRPEAMVTEVRFVDSEGDKSPATCVCKGRKAYARLREEALRQKLAELSTASQAEEVSAAEPAHKILPQFETATWCFLVKVNWCSERIHDVDHIADHRNSCIPLLSSWILPALIGVLTASTGTFIHKASEFLHLFRYSYPDSLEGLRAPWSAWSAPPGTDRPWEANFHGFLAYAGVGVLFATASAILVQVFAPTARGSGIPEVILGTEIYFGLGFRA
eukprot:s2477_g6.t2